VVQVPSHFSQGLCMIREQLLFNSIVCCSSPTFQHNLQKRDFAVTSLGSISNCCVSDKVNLEPKCKNQLFSRLLSFAYTINYHEYLFSICFTRNPLDTLACTATRYGLEGWNSIPGRSKEFLSSPQHLHRLGSPTNTLSKRDQVHFPRM
jgi:hypothetical protein